MEGRSRRILHLVELTQQKSLSDVTKAMTWLRQATRGLRKDFFFFFWEFRNKAKNDKVLHTFHRKRPLISRGKAFSLLFPIHFQIHYTPEGKKKD